MRDTLNHRDLLNALEALMQEWDRAGCVGELVLLRGRNQWVLEKRPIEKVVAAKHEQPGRKQIVRVG